MKEDGDIELQPFVSLVPLVADNQNKNSSSSHHNNSILHSLEGSEDDVKSELQLEYELDVEAILESTHNYDPESEEEDVILEWQNPQDPQNPHLHKDQSIPPSSSTTTFSIWKDRLVIATVSCYCCIATGYLILDETTPLLLKLSFDKGGFGYQSKEIGSLLGLSGIILFLWTFFAIAPIERTIGKLNMLKIGNYIGVLLPVLYVLIPRYTTSALQLEPRAISWILLLAVMCLRNIFSSMAFTAVMILVNNSVTSEYLGQVNGGAQALASLSRAIGPLLGGILWTWSVSIDNLFINFILITVILVCSQLVATIFFVPSLEKQRERMN